RADPRTIARPRRSRSNTAVGSPFVAARRAEHEAAIRTGWSPPEQADYLARAARSDFLVTSLPGIPRHDARGAQRSPPKTYVTRGRTMAIPRCLRPPSATFQTARRRSAANRAAKLPARPSPALD